MAEEIQGNIIPINIEDKMRGVVLVLLKWNHLWFTNV